MKNIKNPLHQPTLGCLIIGLAAFALASYSAKATPYASGCTNYSGAPGSGDQNGDIGFFLNESADSVTVVYDDGTTNANFDGITTGLNVPRGSNYFNLAGHNGYQIRVYKVGSGAPSMISVDTESNSIWANPRGLAVNQNPKIGHEFGRIYVGSTGPGGYGWGTAGFKGRGIYALNADFTTALGQGTNAHATAVFPGGPWRMRVAPAGTGLDNQLLVNDFQTATAALWMFSPDLTSYQPLLKGTSQAAGLAAETHSDSMYGIALVGSLNTGNLQLWITESDWACPANLAEFGPNTGVGMYNLLLRFDIGAGPIPVDGWPGPPQYAYTVGLEGIANLRTEVEIGKDGKIIAAFGRANGSNPNIQILDPTGQTFLYFGGVTPPYYNQNTSGLTDVDPWNGRRGSAAAVGTYAGARVSPDGRYLASADFNSGITIANLVGGIPDETTIFNVPNTPYGSTARGLDWDAAGNIYICSAGTAKNLARAFSLGGTTTCVTSNDWTGTNGAFSVALPPVIATLNVTQPYASQNYINNTPAGTPIPGVARISVNTNFLSAPLTVSFTRGGTARYANPNFAMYSINTNETPNGVIIGTNTVTFPAGSFSGGGNFYVDVKITPTAWPVSTNTQTVVLGLANPSAYQFGTPSQGTVYIQNTGPQLLVLTAPAAASHATMYRGVTNDYAKFIITRYGDTNGPGNSPGSVAQTAFTVTNISYFGTAIYPDDYRARAQRADPAADGKIQTPVDGPTAIVIYPGDTAVTCILGNPVMHTNFHYTPTNLTIVINLTNAVSGAASTNGIPTPEGYTYNVLPATFTLTEIDNAVGPEVVLWSDTMTNPASSVNYTLTFAATNFGVGGMPVVVPNYVNNQYSIYGGGTNDFLVNFGADIGTNLYYTSAYPSAGTPVPPSPVMLVSNWPQKALKMTVNKIANNISGVNVYPNQFFQGNYALRFSMFLSLWNEYVDNPAIAGNYREYALFGVNHYGTNCIWRPSTTMIAGTGMWPTNSDGQWFAVDAGYFGITPADYELYLPGPVPNSANPYGPSGGLRGWVSASASYVGPQGVFKHPPFVTSGVGETTPPIRSIANPGGGQPVNKWVDVSVEINQQTNITLFLNGSQLLARAALTNGLGLAYSYTNGTIMLGYDDPDRNKGNDSAYVLFSNVRVVEMAPYIVVQPGEPDTGAFSLIRTQGSSLTLTAAVTYASAPITNMWYRGTAVAPGTGTDARPTLLVQSNSVNATSMQDTLALNNLAAIDGTNFMAVFSDPAGAVTSTVVAVEVVLTPTSLVVAQGTTNRLRLTSVGPLTTTYQWQTNNVNLVNSTHYAGVTAVDLWITNIQPADAGTYSVIVTNPVAGSVTQYVTLTTVGPLTPAARTNLVGTTFTITAPPITGPVASYQWRKGAANLTDGGRISGATTSTLTITDLATADAGNYTVRVINGSTFTSSACALSVILPKFSGVSLVGSDVLLSYFSPNSLVETTNAFKLQSSAVVTGPYVDTAGNYTISGDGTVQITVPQTGGNRFYRLLHVP